MLNQYNPYYLTSHLRKNFLSAVQRFQVTLLWNVFPFQEKYVESKFVKVPNIIQPVANILVRFIFSFCQIDVPVVF